MSNIAITKRYQQKPIKNWPRVCERGEKDFAISGRCMGMIRREVLQIFSRLLLRGMGYYLLVAGALLPAFVYVQAHLPHWEIGRMATANLLSFRRFVHQSLIAEHPQLSETIWYTSFDLGVYGFNLHLLVAGFLVIAISKPVGFVLGIALSGVFWPFVTKRIRLTIDPEKVVVHRWWGGAVLPRGDPENPVTFRALELSKARPSLVEMAWSWRKESKTTLFTPPTVTVAMHGLRSYRIAPPLESYISEEIVSVCQYTMKQSRPDALDEVCSYF